MGRCCSEIRKMADGHNNVHMCSVGGEVCKAASQWCGRGVDRIRGSDCSVTFCGARPLSRFLWSPLGSSGMERKIRKWASAERRYGSIVVVSHALELDVTPCHNPCSCGGATGWYACQGGPSALVALWIADCAMVCWEATTRDVWFWIVVSVGDPHKSNFRALRYHRLHINRTTGSGLESAELGLTQPPQDSRMAPAEHGS